MQENVLSFDDLASYFIILKFGNIFSAHIISFGTFIIHINLTGKANSTVLK